MKLERLLKPIKYLDENIILRQYTKIGQKINIDEGKRKYWIGFGLNLSYVNLSTTSNRALFGSAFDWTDFFLLSLQDAWYNLDGIFGRFKESNSANSIILDQQKERYKEYNSFVRLPTFLFGVGLIGKFGMDLANSIKNKNALEPTSYYCLFDGLAHLSLASSMYLKETDTKLLDKTPIWKKALNYAKEKIDSLNPVPVPVPVTKNF
jgi:hypothetical protein